MLLNSWNDDICTGLSSVLITFFRICNLFLSYIFISMGCIYVSKKICNSVLYTLTHLPMGGENLNIYVDTAFD